MTREVPAIFSPPTRPIRLGWRGRTLAAGAAVACLALLAAAAYLTPDPAGVGTQGRLGLQPCSFLQRTGLPCAACGMSTSFGHFARLDFPRSFWAQPMGLLLAVLTCVAFWGSAYAAGTGRTAGRLLSRLPTARLLVLGAGIWIVSWGFKMALVLGDRAGTDW